jgi:hypothetical protein
MRTFFLRLLIGACVEVYTHIRLTDEWANQHIRALRSHNLIGKQREDAINGIQDAYVTQYQPGNRYRA